VNGLLEFWKPITSPERFHQPLQPLPIFSSCTYILPVFPGPLDSLLLLADTWVTTLSKEPSPQPLDRSLIFSTCTRTITRPCVRNIDSLRSPSCALVSPQWAVQQRTLWNHSNNHWISHQSSIAVRELSQDRAPGISTHSSLPRVLCLVVSNLYTNQLSGTIPTFIGSLTNLQSLYEPLFSTNCPPASCVVRPHDGEFYQPSDRPITAAST